jgi:hypothetical protein
MARTGRPETPIRWRFLEKITFDPETGCWLWTGAACPQGYGFIKRKDGAQLRAHRVAYELAYGPVISSSAPHGTTPPTWSPRGVPRGMRGSATARHG